MLFVNVFMFNATRLVPDNLFLIFIVFAILVVIASDTERVGYFLSTNRDAFTRQMAS